MSLESKPEERNKMVDCKDCRHSVVNPEALAALAADSSAIAADHFVREPIPV